MWLLFLRFCGKVIFIVIARKEFLLVLAKLDVCGKMKPSTGD
jgi:hypothetical protein